MRKTIMALVLMPLLALADTEKVGDVTWSYKVSSEKVTIKGVEPCVGKLEIPQTLGGYPVSSIGAAAFSDCGELAELVIPEGVADIGAAAFCDCIGLTTLTIPSSMVSIGDAAFEGCEILATIRVSAGDTEGVKAMIADSDSDIDVDSLIFIEPLGDGGPYKETVNGIEWTFMISEGVASVGAGVYDITAVSEGMVGAIEIPSTLAGCPVTIIGDFAFFNCSGLTSVTIPSSVTSIGERAFLGCSGLTAVTIPEGVTSIGDSTFFGCLGLTSILVVEGNASFCSVDGIMYDKAVKTLICCPAGKTGTVTIPSSVISIGGSAFSRCTGLRITIPASVTSIGDFAFASCDDLKLIVNPDVFYNPQRDVWDSPFLHGDVSVTIPEGVTSIGAKAFLNCSGLTSVTIPESVTSIGDSAFCGCESLLRVYYQGAAPLSVGWEIYWSTPATLVSYVCEGSVGWSFWTSAYLPGSWQERPIAYGEAPVVIDGVEWDFTTKNGKVSLGTGRMTAVEGSVDGSVTIPAEINGMKVVEVKDNAFAGLDKITSVTIPASVRTIGSKAFYGCDGLESVTFLGDAPYVYDDAFSGTKSTLAFSVPQGSIGWSDTSLTGLPGAWKGHAIQYAGGGQEPSRGEAVNLGTVTVSNVVVHYILNSVQPEFAIQPADDMSFVNIITEVKGSAAVAIPETWAANYPGFADKFGTDFTQALLKPSGKIGTGGTPMLVWQDYVAGTDPTNEKDVFTASITIVDGKVTISYTPELDDARKAMRKYTTWGKTSLMNTDWTEVQDGHESEYNFFKVSVEMR